MKRSTRLWIALGVTFAVLQVFFLVGKEIWFKQYSIKSGAMEPTLLRGDRTFVTRTKEIARGDLMVFHLPTEAAPFVKRAIALAGDTIEMDDKQVRINGKDLNEPYVQFEDDKTSLRHFGPYRVPAGHIFVLGDNRDNSNDSRYHGAVPMPQVIGRVIYIFSLENGPHRPARTAK